MYATPFGVDVAVLVHGPAPWLRIELQVLDLLSTVGLPATQRADYLANDRALMKIVSRRLSGDNSPRLLKAMQRRAERFLAFRHALSFVETTLIEQVSPGDHLTCGDARVVAVDPDLRRDCLGRRLYMRVQVLPSHRSTIDRPADGLMDLSVVGLRPTLGLI